MCIYIYIIIPLRVLSRYIIHTTTHNFIPTYMILFFNNEINTKKKINCGLIPTHYKCICILVLTTLRMVTWVTETCQWLLYNKFTFIHPPAFVGLLKKIVYLYIYECRERVTYKLNIFASLFIKQMRYRITFTGNSPTLDIHIPRHTHARKQTHTHTQVRTRNPHQNINI